MKKILLTLVLLIGIVFGLLAQQLTYQAVIRDNNQQLVTNTAVTATVTIDFAGDQTDYNTTITGVSTNIHGLLSFEFGGAELSDRDWTNATIAVKVVNAATPSIVYVDGEPRPVSAVPYALSVNGSSIQNYLTENHYVDLDKLNDTLSAYSTTAVMDARHYLTSDSAVIGNMRGDITTNANSIADLTLHTAKAAIRDSVADQVHDSIVNIAAKSHTHSNKDLLDTYNQTNTDLTDAVAKKHEHANMAVLNATTAPYTDADSTKLRGIQDSAEVNVQSDWKQMDATKDDYIKNKPSIKDTVNGILTTEGYVTATALDARHYLTSDSAVITTMQSDISKNVGSIDNLILHTAKAAIRDSVAGQIHDSIVNIAAKSHTHSNKALLDTYTQTEANLADAVAKKHEHANMAVLNATTAPYTDADSTKLRGIQDSAEVNVQADWKQMDATKDDYIKNKPSIKDTVDGILTTEGYVTATALDARHYLTSDSAVIGNMRGDISTNKANIQTNTGTIGALAAKEQSDSSLLAGRINALENASMDCDDVKDCIKDTLSKYTPTTDLTGMLQQLEAGLTATNTVLNDLLQQLEARLADKIDSLAQIVDSLSNLPHGGGDTPTEVADGQPCPGAATVSDGTNTYNTVKIGNQCWMKENLRTNVGDGVYPKKNNGQDELFEDEKVTYGRLYTWNAMMKGAPSTNYPAGTTDADTIVHGICPAGWHVPSDAEWDTLTHYVFSKDVYKCGDDCGTWQAQSNVSCIAKALSQPTGWSNTGTGCYAGNRGDKANATGFAAVPAGDCFNGRFNDFGIKAAFWSATNGDGDARCRNLFNNDSHVYSFTDRKDSGCSVRCLRDAGVGGGDNPSEPATMSCEQVMECMGDTLGKLNTKIEEQGTEIETLNGTVTTQGQTIETLNSTVQSQGETITTQGHTIDSLARIVDSLSNLTPGGDTPDTPTAFTCGTDKVMDVDGNEYSTVIIGKQCWMKENLKTTKKPNGDAIAEGVYVPNGDSSEVETYGRLYTWSVVMNGAGSTNYPDEGEKVQGICPEGWHVPSDAEWDTLTRYVYNSTDPDYKCSICSSSVWEQSTKCIAKALSSTTGWSSNTSEGCNAGNTGEKSNATGFSAVPAGHCFSGFGSLAYFWSATQDDDYGAWCRCLASNFSYVFSINVNKDSGFSVRCLRDAGVGGGTTPDTPDTPTAFTCGTSKVKDVDYNEYNTVQIGTQCWMKENLRTTKYANGGEVSSEKMYNPGNSADNVPTYGLLYTWSAATRDSSTTYPADGQVKVQGICPTGWHVPSDAEWDTLTRYVFNSTSPNYKCGENCGKWQAQNSVSCIAKALASTTGWDSNTNEGCNAGNTGDKANATGFAAVPAGHCFIGSFIGFSDNADFWSATQGDANDAWCRYLLGFDSGVYRSNDSKDYGYSVRCLRD